MLPGRVPLGQNPAMRKSRLEGKQSLIPKPRRPGSIDRQSMEARRPSNTGHRSSSADPPRATFAGRLSKETPKLPMNQRSRSQQGEKFGQSSMTPLRSSQYLRPTITPQRTPSGERNVRSWQQSLERALAFVTIKDQRPISNAAWQRAEYTRVQEGLAARGGAAGGLALLRPLTIARFVHVAGTLLGSLTRDFNLNTDNYVAKLQGMSKRLLYPGTVSKSWLKAVNTLHAFPQALAFVSYLLDMANHVEMEVTEEWLYTDNDDLARLRREFLYKSWLRFQEQAPQFEDLNNEYLRSLRELLGDNKEKIAAIMLEAKQLEEQVDEEGEAAAREDEARRAARREALQAGVRSARAALAAHRSRLAAAAAAAADAGEELAQLDLDIERANADNQKLTEELESQKMSVSERARLLDDLDYAVRVKDSKQLLLDQISVIVNNKEHELAVWQKKTLDVCVQYNQLLISLQSRFPHFSALTVDEKELMAAECSARVARAVDTLRECSAALAARCADLERSKTSLARRRKAQMEQVRTEIEETKASLASEQAALAAEAAREAADGAAWPPQRDRVHAQLEDAARKQLECDEMIQVLQFWEAQDQAWRAKLAEMNEHIEKLKIEKEQEFERERDKRIKLVVDAVKTLKEKHLVLEA